MGRLRNDSASITSSQPDDASSNSSAGSYSERSYQSSRQSSRSGNNASPKAASHSERSGHSSPSGSYDSRRSEHHSEDFSTSEGSSWHSSQDSHRNRSEQSYTSPRSEQSSQPSRESGSSQRHWSTDAEEEYSSHPSQSSRSVHSVDLKDYETSSHHSEPSRGSLASSSSYIEEEISEHGSRSEKEIEHSRSSSSKEEKEEDNDEEEEVWKDSTPHDAEEEYSSHPSQSSRSEHSVNLIDDEASSHHSEAPRGSLASSSSYIEEEISEHGSWSEKEIEHSRSSKEEETEKEKEEDHDEEEEVSKHSTPHESSDHSSRSRASEYSKSQEDSKSQVLAEESKLSQGSSNHSKSQGSVSEQFISDRDSLDHASNSQGSSKDSKEKQEGPENSDFSEHTSTNQGSQQSSESQGHWPAEESQNDEFDGFGESSTPWTTAQGTSPADDDDGIFEDDLFADDDSPAEAEDDSETPSSPGPYSNIMEDDFEDDGTFFEMHEEPHEVDAFFSAEIKDSSFSEDGSFDGDAAAAGGEDLAFSPPMTSEEFGDDKDLFAEGDTPEDGDFFPSQPTDFQDDYSTADAILSQQGRSVTSMSASSKRSRGSKSSSNRSSSMIKTEPLDIFVEGTQDFFSSQQSKQPGDAVSMSSKVSKDSRNSRVSSGSQGSKNTNTDPRMTISEILPPRLAPTRQGSGLSGMVSKDSKVSMDTSITLSDVFAGSPVKSPMSHGDSRSQADQSKARSNQSPAKSDAASKDFARPPPHKPSPTSPLKPSPKTRAGGLFSLPSLRSLGSKGEKEKSMTIEDVFGSQREQSSSGSHDAPPNPLKSSTPSPKALSIDKSSSRRTPPNPGTIQEEIASVPPRAESKSRRRSDSSKSISKGSGYEGGSVLDQRRKVLDDLDVLGEAVVTDSDLFGPSPSNASSRLLSRYSKDPTIIVSAPFDPFGDPTTTAREVTLVQSRRNSSGSKSSSQGSQSKDEKLGDQLGSFGDEDQSDGNLTGSSPWKPKDEESITMFDVFRDPQKEQSARISRSSAASISNSSSLKYSTHISGDDAGSLSFSKASWSKASSRKSKRTRESSKSSLQGGSFFSMPSSKDNRSVSKPSNHPSQSSGSESSRSRGSGSSHPSQYSALASTRSRDSGSSHSSHPSVAESNRSSVSGSSHPSQSSASASSRSRISGSSHPSQPSASTSSRSRDTGSSQPSVAESNRSRLSGSSHPSQSSASASSRSRISGSSHPSQSLASASSRSRNRGSSRRSQPSVAESNISRVSGSSHPSQSSASASSRPRFSGSTHPSQSPASESSRYRVSRSRHPSHSSVSRSNKSSSVRSNSRRTRTSQRSDSELGARSSRSGTARSGRSGFSEFGSKSSRSRIEHSGSSHSVSSTPKSSRRSPSNFGSRSSRSENEIIGSRHSSSHGSRSDSGSSRSKSQRLITEHCRSQSSRASSSKIKTNRSESNVKPTNDRNSFLSSDGHDSLTSSSIVGSVAHRSKVGVTTKSSIDWPTSPTISPGGEEPTTSRVPQESQAALDSKELHYIEPNNVLSDSKPVGVLKAAGVSLSMKKQEVHVSINNEGFLLAVEVAYQKLKEIRPRLAFLLSLAEWRHVHILMLYARIFRCEVAAAGIVQPPEFSIALPPNIQVLEPLATVLESIGIVEDTALGVVYIPVAKPVRDGAYEPHDPEDVTEFLEWTQYDWNASWERVEVEREERRKAAIENGVKLPEKTFPPNHAKLLEWEYLALEKWLGWDESLWFSYEQATRMLSREFSLVNFPKLTIGTYSWLIPRSNKDGGAICRVPKPSLSSDVWMIALLFNFCALPLERTNTWYYETKPTPDVLKILEEFVGSARKS